MNTLLFFKSYVAVAGAMVVAYVLLPENQILLAGWQLMVGWLAALSIFFSVKSKKLAAATGWYFCAAGIFLNTAGIGIDFICVRYFGFTLYDYPRPADFLWLMMYPMVAIGLSILAHRRASGQDWSSIIDAAIIVTDLGLIAWVFLVHESAQHFNSALAVAFVVSYPIGDLALLGVLIRLVLQGKSDGTIRLIAFSLFLFLCGDLGWAAAHKLDMLPAGLKQRLLQTVFLAAFSCFAAAALWPTNRDEEPRRIRGDSLSRKLLIILTLTSLVPSALLFYQAATGLVKNGIAISIGSGILFLLVIIRVVGLLRKVQQQAVQLNALSRTDELTGLFNRRAWMEELNLSLERARRDKSPLSIALIDLDRFKIFNDKFGHIAGDDLLKSAAKIWREDIRVPDILGRYGGEEFILILPNADLPEGKQIIERLRPITPDNQTFSAGLALWNGEETAEHLLMRADVALYRAKESGRNRTVLANTNDQ